MRRIVIFVMVFLATLVSAQGTNIESISEAPWLRNHLPEKMTAYVRIPHPMFFFTPTDTPLKPLFTNKNYRQSIGQIKDKLITHIDTLKSLSDEEKAGLKLLLSHLRAPIEIMVGELDGVKNPPTVLVATKLDYRNSDTFVAGMKKLASHLPFEIKVNGKDTGELVLHEFPAKATYEYQADTGKLLITVANKPSDLSNIIRQKLPSNTPSFIADRESLIDESGQGLFATVNIHPMMLASIQPQHIMMSMHLGVDSIESVSFGMGVANQRPKIKLSVDMPQNGLRNLIPAYANVTSPNYYGELNSLMSLSVPNENMTSRLFDLLGGKGTYEKFTQQFNQAIGVDFDDILWILGRNFTFFSDDNGRYIATDEKFDADVQRLIQQLNEKDIPIALTEEIIHGQVIKHLSLLPLYTHLDKTTRDQETREELMTMRWMMQNHYYWVIEGDKVIISSIPQTLWVRKQLQPTGTLKALLEKHHANKKAAFINGVINIRNLSQSAYYQQLNYLAKLGDITNLPININHYPAANELSFPRYGMMAFSIDNSGGQLSIEYSLENGLSDLAVLGEQSGQLTTIGAIGILAAIAMPAYQDYTVRSKLSYAIMRAAQLQKAIEKEMLAGTQTKNINSDAFVTIISQILKTTPSIQLIEVDEANINIYFESNNEEYMLTLSPTISEWNQVNWSCHSEGLPNRQRPKACR